MVHERRQKIVERAKSLAKASLSVGVLAVPGIVTTGCSDVQEEGVRSKVEARQQALERYNRTFDASRPAAKFILQYIEPTRIDIMDVDRDYGLKDTHRFLINNGCLRRTPYNVTRGAAEASIVASWLFGGTTPQAKAKDHDMAFARVDSDSPDKMTITTGYSGSFDLHFKNVAGKGPLVPEDKQTRDIVEGTYGCASDFTVSYEHVTGERQRYTSPYVISDPIQE